MLALSALVAGALPPGYEDEAWCPPDHCIRAIPQEPGFVGPQSMFVECAHIETGEAAAAFWTGARVNAVPLPGWVKVKSFLDESFKSVECDTSTADSTPPELSARLPNKVGARVSKESVGGKQGLGPAWTRGEIEAPQGEKSMGSWTAAVYTPEQQANPNPNPKPNPNPNPNPDPSPSPSPNPNPDPGPIPNPDPDPNPNPNLSESCRALFGCLRSLRLLTHAVQPVRCDMHACACMHFLCTFCARSHSS